MAKKEKQKVGIQQSAGLIRYFDQEEETAIHINPKLVIVASFASAVVIALINYLYPVG